MKTRHCILLLTAALVYSLTSPANADADRTDDLPAITVSFADLDLSKPAGANMLYSRIRSAARAICRSHESIEPGRIARSRACYRSAVDNAVAQVNRPLLSAAHERRTGKQVEAIKSAQR